AMLLHQSDGTFTDFRGKLVALAHGSIFSRNAASSKPGVIQVAIEDFGNRKARILVFVTDMHAGSMVEVAASGKLQGIEQLG
ncbi:MAG: hypothetical protein OZ927_19565, partial [Alcaligenaceae bacterium]|nr:hypothetical protein [Alcaligenaceae bacterium]